MNSTVDYPKRMQVFPEHAQPDGRTLVYVYENDEQHRQSLILWISPEVAAQWVEALTPLAAKAQQ